MLQRLESRIIQTYSVCFLTISCFLCTRSCRITVALAQRWSCIAGRPGISQLRLSQSADGQTERCTIRSNEPPLQGERGDPMSQSDRDTTAGSTVTAQTVSVCVFACVCNTAATTTWHYNLQIVLTHACTLCEFVCVCVCVCVCVSLTLPECLSAALWCELADMKELSENDLLL